MHFSIKIPDLHSIQRFHSSNCVKIHSVLSLESLIVVVLFVFISFFLFIFFARNQHILWSRLHNSVDFFLASFQFILSAYKAASMYKKEITSTEVFMKLECIACYIAHLFNEIAFSFFLFIFAWILSCLPR